MKKIENPAQPNLKDLINNCENEILSIKKSLYFLSDFYKTLETKTKRKSFKIKNDIIYEMAIHHFDMMIINLSSFSDKMVGKGGFFNQLIANLNLLKPLRETDFTPPKTNIILLNRTMTDKERLKTTRELDNNYRKNMAIQNREVLYKLFLNLKDRETLKINADDVAELKEKFRTLTESIRADRDKNRAHKYDIKDKTHAERLSVEKIEEKFKQIEEIMNNLRLAFSASTLAYLDVNHACTEATSNDLVNIILWGSNAVMDYNCRINENINKTLVDKFKHAEKLREDHLNEAHEVHELILNGQINPSDYGISKPLEDICFNDILLNQIKK